MVEHSMMTYIANSIVDTQMFVHKIGAVIRRLRKEKCMSGMELAAKLGISQQQISRYESAQSVMTIVMFLKVCIIFDVTPDVFFSYLPHDIYNKKLIVKRDV